MEPSPQQKIFLLSPANCGAKRASIVLRDAAAFDLAVRLRKPRGVAIGEVFSFLSGLYFRGKLAYARRFGAAAHVITTDRGLLTADRRVTADDLRAMGGVPIDADDPRYRSALERDARRFIKLNPDHLVVLLGSVASGKYVDVLLPILGERLLFPREFVGRGDMSRGGLMLRCVREDRELEYIPVSGAVRHGVRPPKLERVR
jgi:hypothetical protein